MYRDVPHTGVIREYTFTISRGNIAPDGVNISAILVNGAFPGEWFLLIIFVFLC